MQLIVDSGQLPVGWEVKTIGEVCKTGAGGTPLKSKKEYYEGGKIPWLLTHIPHPELSHIKKA
ncbi:restriction endonuclease subunit S [Aphanizomenon sp. PH219]|uniref:Restriction endonuclease subunit S n=1 Tax=Dolichospermum heterosporum TAC447 TaxID=747523 RepID=A0ABY5M076_9CYAN|nr:restriction endonuclease subunit S [Dolichospermum heterosporum]MDK2412363.1 restriction endonuclease subunit S [Aphanizomenon sp. 202]MDK2460338.1 restriction endonuclease subunit S [Aphanizomenon sp. PH219]UUO16437.1 restriction endonuclease subunit S [Dolichospermum heterosporum TAC447]